MEITEVQNNSKKNWRFDKLPKMHLHFTVSARQVPGSRTCNMWSSKHLAFCLVQEIFQHFLDKKKNPLDNEATCLMWSANSWKRPSSQVINALPSSVSEETTSRLLCMNWRWENNWCFILLYCWITVTCQVYTLGKWLSLAFPVDLYFNLQSPDYNTETLPNLSQSHPKGKQSGAK